MICYRDETFCPFHKNCSKGKDCHRALTDQVEKDAVKWWGSEDAPICVFSSKPDCFNKK